jgi:hypothetical protein
MLAITAFLVNPRPEHRVWVTTTLAATLAALIHFRPNNILASVALFAALYFKSQRDAKSTSTNHRFPVVISFVLVMLLSLVHNLYYGGQFVLFTPNPNNMYAFDFFEVVREQSLGTALMLVWEQLRIMMHWQLPDDPNFAIFFWGAQLALVAAIVLRARKRVLTAPMTVVALLPLTYAVPMLPFTLESYFPRLIVAASLLCLCAALIVWPRKQHGSALTS